MNICSWQESVNCILLFAFGMYVYYHPKFSIHPYPFMSLVCLVESFGFYNRSLKYIEVDSLLHDDQK